MVSSASPAGQQPDSSDEISTDELQTILAKGSATVLDARPHLEFAISHIPGALNVAPRSGVPMSMYVSDVAEIGRLVRGNKSAAIPRSLVLDGKDIGEVRRAKIELDDLLRAPVGSEDDRRRSQRRRSGAAGEPGHRAGAPI